MLLLRSLREFLVHDSTNTVNSFLLSSAAAYVASRNSVARWMFFFIINLLTSNLLRRLGLPFEIDNFLGGGSEFVEVPEDLAL